MRKIVMLFAGALLVAGLATPAFADEGRRDDHDRYEHSDREWRGHDHDGWRRSDGADWRCRDRDDRRTRDRDDWRTRDRDDGRWGYYCDYGRDHDRDDD